MTSEVQGRNLILNYSITSRLRSSISPIPSVTPGDFFRARYRGVQQRAFGHRFNHGTAIFGGRPNVADRFAFLGRYGRYFRGEFLGERLAFEHPFGIACSNRCRRDGPESDPNTAAAFVGADNISNRNPDVSQIHHVARRELNVLTDELWTRLRNNYFGENFIWAHNSLARSQEKFLQGNHPFAIGVNGFCGCIQSDQTWSHVSGRCSVGHIATDGCPVSDLD